MTTLDQVPKEDALGVGSTVLFSQGQYFEAEVEGTRRSAGVRWAGVRWHQGGAIFLTRNVLTRIFSRRFYTKSLTHFLTRNLKNCKKNVLKNFVLKNSKNMLQNFV